MLIDLKPVREEPYSWREAAQISAESLEQDSVRELSPVDVAGRISFVAPSFYFKARLRYVQTLVCDRCIADFEDPVDTTLELLIKVEEGAQPDLDLAEGEEQELTEEDLGELTIHEEALDTTPLLREHIQLQVPMKPLCREDCAGLCPQCGADRNSESCDCKETTTDPRWAALEKLKIT